MVARGDRKWPLEIKVRRRAKEESESVRERGNGWEEVGSELSLAN